MLSHVENIVFCYTEDINKSIFQFKQLCIVFFCIYSVYKRELCV